MSETIFQQFIDKKNKQNEKVYIKDILRLSYAHNEKNSTIKYNNNNAIKNVDLWRYFSGETEHTKKLSELLSKNSLDFSGVDFSEILPGTDDNYLSYFLANPAHKNAYENLKDLSNFKIPMDKKISKEIKQDILMFNDDIASDNLKELTNLYYHFPLEFTNLLYKHNKYTFYEMVQIVKKNVTASGELFDKNIIDIRLKSLTSKQDLSTQFNDLSENRLLTYKKQLIQYSPNLRKLINNFNLMRKDNDELLYYFLWSLMNNALDEKDLNEWHKNKKNIKDKNKAKSEKELSEEKNKWNSIIDNSYTINIGKSEDSDKLHQKLEMGHKIGKKFKKFKNLDTTFCKKRIADLFIEHFTCKTPYDLGKNQLSEFYKNSTELYKNLCINPDNIKYEHPRPKLSILDIAFLCDDDMDETLLKILIPHIKHLRPFVKGAQNRIEGWGKDAANVMKSAGESLSSTGEAVSAAVGRAVRGVGNAGRWGSEKFGEGLRLESLNVAGLSDEKEAREKARTTRGGTSQTNDSDNMAMAAATAAAMAVTTAQPAALDPVPVPELDPESESESEPVLLQPMIYLIKRFITYYNNINTKSNKNLNDIYKSMKNYIYCYFMNLDFDKLSLPQYIYYMTHDENSNKSMSSLEQLDNYMYSREDDIVNKTNFSENVDKIITEIEYTSKENNISRKYINKEVFGALKIAWREAMIDTMLYDNGGLIFNTNIFLKSKLIDALGLRNESNPEELDNLLLYLICEKAYEKSGLTGVPIEESFLNNTTLLSNIRKRCESYKYQNLLPRLRSSLNYLNESQQENEASLLESKFEKQILGGNKARIVKNKYIKTMANRKRYVKRRSIKNYKEKSKKHKKPMKNNHSSKRIKIKKH